MKLFAALINDILDHAQKGEEIVPVGVLTFDKYKHKQYGWIHNPVFAVKDWRKPDDSSPVEGEASAGEPVKEEPKARTRGADTKTAVDVAQTETGANVDDEELAETYAAVEAEQATAPRRRQRR
jgi:hypothetical protein